MNKNILLEKVTKYLTQKYNCHTIILYGSYSRDDFTEESDLDIVCFSDITVDKNNIEREKIAVARENQRNDIEVAKINASNRASKTKK